MAELPSVFGGSGSPDVSASRRLLFVHAHPDDEASKGASTVAKFASEGARVSLVTCTGGEAGEVLNESYGDVHPNDMPKIREQELLESVDILGFASVYMLGHPDSGWWENLDEVPAGTFHATPTDEVALQLAEVLVHERPQVVVTYPEDGGYPHPDHIKVHAVTMRAVELAASHPSRPWVVDRVFASTVWTMHKMIAMDDEAVARGMERVHQTWIDMRRERGQVEAPADVRVEVGDWLEHRDRALRAHATQVDPDGTWFAHSRDIERDVAPWEEYHLLLGTLPARPAPDTPLDDLFAGLNPA